MNSIKLVSLVITLFCLSSFASQAQAQQRGVRKPAPAVAAPGTATGNAAEKTNKIPYIRCETKNGAKDYQISIGDYEGRHAFLAVPKGRFANTLELSRPMKLTAVKNGTNCSITAKNADLTVQFQYSTALGPIAASLIKTGGSTTECTLNADAPYKTLKACQIPPVQTIKTLPDSCSEVAPSLAEQTFSCARTTEFLKKPASGYSLRHCSLYSAASAENVCVAQASCTLKPNLPANLASKVASWPSPYPSYVACRPDANGECSKNANDCRADKSIYFTNASAGTRAIKIDVGLEMPGTAVSSAPTGSGTAAIPQPAENTTPTRMRRTTGSGQPGSKAFEFRPGAQ